MPFFNDLDGDPEPIQSDHALTPAKIDTGKMLQGSLGKA